MTVVITNNMHQHQLAQLVKTDGQGNRYFDPVARGFLNRNNARQLIRIAKNDETIKITEL